MDTRPESLTMTSTAGAPPKPWGRSVLHAVLDGREVVVRDASPSPTEPANGHVNFVPTLLNETVLGRSTLDDGTLLLIPVEPRRHAGDRAHEKPTLATGWVCRGFFLCQREFAERDLDDSPELLVDQLPLQRAARDGQPGIFGHGGF
jgi:hypothetical protein